jgi:hypothetical protein
MTHNVMIGMNFAYRQSTIDSQEWQLTLYGMGEEFHIDQDGIRRNKGGVVPKEEGGDLRSAGGLVWWLWRRLQSMEGKRHTSPYNFIAGGFLLVFYLTLVFGSS